MIVQIVPLSAAPNGPSVTGSKFRANLSMPPRLGVASTAAAATSAPPRPHADRSTPAAGSEIPSASAFCTNRRRSSLPSTSPSRKLSRSSIVWPPRALRACPLACPARLPGIRRRSGRVVAPACRRLPGALGPGVGVGADLGVAPSRLLDQPADPAGSLFVRLDRAPLGESVGEDEILVCDLVGGALERPAKGEPLAVAVGVEPDPVEPELERDLEDPRKALLGVG